MSIDFKFNLGDTVYFINTCNSIPVIKEGIVGSIQVQGENKVSTWNNGIPKEVSIGLRPTYGIINYGIKPEGALFRSKEELLTYLN